jgi:hypothetical protein
MITYYIHSTMVVVQGNRLYQVPSEVYGTVEKRTYIIVHQNANDTFC